MDSAPTEALTKQPEFSSRELAKITTDEQYVGIVEYRKEVVHYKKQVKTWFRGDDSTPGPLKRAYDLYQDLLSKEKTALEPANSAEERCNELIVAYDDQKQAEAVAEQKRQEEAARIKAETEQLEAAAAMELEANRTGDVDLMEEAERLVEEVPIAAPVHVTVQTPKVSGMVLKDNWGLHPTIPVDVIKLARAIGSKQPGVDATYLIPNVPALNARAKSSNGTAVIPGVTFYNNRHPSGTGGKKKK